jgi:hypothetical protein
VRIFAALLGARKLADCAVSDLGQLRRNPQSLHCAAEPEGGLED